MKLICCVEERNGWLFHQRRLSSDRKQAEDLLSLIGGERLYLTGYSERLFPMEKRKQLVLVSSVKEVLERGGYAFAEEELSAADINKAKELIVYCWNRKYPFDVRFPMMEEVWRQGEKKELSGHSHRCITRIRYERKGRK